MVETIHIKGENGLVLAHDLPLGEGIADRLAKGHLRRVNEDGSDYMPEPEAEHAPDQGVVVASKPAANAPKADWIGWAVAQGANVEDAEAMTKADLIDKFSK
jgi:3-hydroxyisobutyrate dehydrogenase-like beta-hydroxyacid dehydrogenase